MTSERVVVLMKDFLGDAVMATPLIDGLIAANCEVSVCTTEPIHKMLEAPFRRLEFVPLDRSRSVKAAANFARKLRAGKYDVAVAVNRSFRSALAARLAGIRTRVGHRVERRGMLLTHSIPYDWNANEAECYLDLGRVLGLDLPSIEPKLVPTEEERRAGLELLNGAVVGVQAGATWDQKRLDLDVLAQVIDRLESEGTRVALIGGKDEIDTAEALSRKTNKQVVNLVGATNLRGTLGVLANLQFALGGDTGLMHMTAATGTATVSVFGPKPASKWGHYNPPHQVLEAPGGFAPNATFELIWPAIERVRPALKAT